MKGRADAMWPLLWRSVAAIVLLTVAAPADAAVQIELQTASGGVIISGAYPNYSAGFGAINGLGVGSPAAGVTILSGGVTGGVLYTTPYNMFISGIKNADNGVTAYASSNFSHPAILVLNSCPYNATCTSAANFSALSTNAAAPTTIIARPGVADKATSRATLAIFVANTNGSGAFTGSDTATITFVAKNYQNNQTDTITLTLNNQTVQTAVRLTLATASGGSIIAAGSDYAIDYSNVNGLGIGPATGLTTLSVSGGSIYATPYLLQPAFSSFSSTTGTLKAYVSTDFAHPSILELRDSSSSGGTYGAISKSSGAPTTLSSATSGTNVTRYLGLFVSNANGSGTFTGADVSTLTYTLIVP
jgi:hypothetical protein